MPAESVPENTEPLLTVAEVAAILKVSPRWVYQRARSGELRSGTFGRTLRFKLADVTAYIEAQMRPARAGTGGGVSALGGPRPTR